MSRRMSEKFQEEENMLMLSDGRKIVFGVFSADGCECEELEKIFECEEDALRHMEIMKSYSDVDGRPTMPWDSPFHFYGNAEFLSVRQLQIFPGGCDFTTTPFADILKMS